MVTSYTQLIDFSVDRSPQRNLLTMALGKPLPSFGGVMCCADKNKPKRFSAYLMSACLHLEHRRSSKQTLFDPWRALLLVSAPKQLLGKSKVLACSVSPDQSITVKKRDDTLHMTSCHTVRKEISCLSRMQTSSKNTAGFLCGGMVTILKWLSEVIQAFSAGVKARALVQDSPRLQEGDCAHHSIQIITYLLGQRERTA